MNFTFREANFVQFAATHILCLFLAAMPAYGVNFASVWADESLESALTNLTASASSDRVRAERWLATHLKPEDFSALRDAAISGSSEVRTRITHALGADDRHLGLAMAMIENKDTALIKLGEDAVSEMISRWHTGMGQPLASDLPGQPELRDAMRRLNAEWPTEYYRLELAGNLSEVIGRLARLGKVPVPVFADPFAENQVLTGAEPGSYLEGTWDELLRKLAIRYGVKLEGALAFDEKLGQVPAFLCFRPSTAGGASSVASLLTEWCRASLATKPQSTRAARALAASGWPAALQWLDRRYRDAKDEASLAGLLMAASRGRIPLCLSDADVVRELLAKADRVDAESTESAIMHALMSLTPIAVDGERLDEVLIENWMSLKPRALQFRLIVLEGMESTSTKVREALRELLARPAPAVDAAVRLQALRAWSATATGLEVELAGLTELVAAIETANQAEELVRLLLAARVAPDEHWQAPDNFPNQSVIVRTMLLEWNFCFGRTRAATAYLERLTNWKDGWPKFAQDRQAHALTGGTLRRLIRRGEGLRVGQWLESLFAAEQDGDAKRVLHRIAILSGAPVTDRALRDLALLNWLVPSENATFPTGDEIVLGVLAGRKVAGTRSRARALLLQQLGRALSQQRTFDINSKLARQAFRGLERCIEELFERGADYEVKLLATEIHGLMRRFQSHPLAEDVAANSWPFGPSSRFIDFARNERSL